MRLRSWILWQGEKIGSKIISKIFWPPSKVSVLVLEEDKLLAVDPGTYLMLPGGLVEKGENFQEAARREVKEETGLEITGLERLEENRDHLPGVEVVFLAEASGTLSGSWEGKPLWIDIEDAENRRWRFNRDIGSLLDKIGK